MIKDTNLNKKQIITIILLVLFSPLAIDIYLPAFPEMAVAFTVNKVIIQDSMTWFMFSLGIGQLVAGPLADHFGRRPIALYGIAIYALSATIISMTHNFNILLIARLFQGVGACACSVVAFTAVRDCFGPKKSTQMISYLNAIICFIMATAPILGNSLTQYFGWQSNFIFMLAYALIVGSFVILSFNETRAIDSMPLEDDSIKKIMSKYILILNQQTFFYHVCLCMLSMSVILAYVSSAPTWLMMELGINSNQFTLWFGISAIINILACLYTPKAINRFGIKTILSTGITILLCSGSLMLLLSSYKEAWAFMIPMFIASIGYGLILASAAGEALAPFSKNTGSAAALLGLFQMSGAGLIVTVLQWLNLDAPILLALTMLLLIPSLFILKSKSSRSWYLVQEEIIK